MSSYRSCMCSKFHRLKIIIVLVKSFILRKHVKHSHTIRILFGYWSWFCWKNVAKSLFYPNTEKKREKSSICGDDNILVRHQFDSNTISWFISYEILLHYTKFFLLLTHQFKFFYARFERNLPIKTNLYRCLINSRQTTHRKIYLWKLNTFITKLNLLKQTLFPIYW